MVPTFHHRGTLRLYKASSDPRQLCGCMRSPANKSAHNQQMQLSLNCVGHMTGRKARARDVWEKRHFNWIAIFRIFSRSHVTILHEIDGLGQHE
jgi:hypothetical protein